MAGLTRQQDAFGWGIYDHFRGRPSQIIVERDDGYIEGLGLTGCFAESAACAAYEKNALDLACGRVLDVGAGAGRVALHLQSHGLDVVGIDNSPLAAKVCKARGVKKVKVLPFNRISLKLGLFDTVVMYGNNFGLFGSFARARLLLRRLHVMTTPNARILGATLDPYQTSDPKHLAYHRRNRACGRMGGQIRLRVRYKDYATPWFDYLLVSKKELTGILKGTGWRLARCFDGRNGRYVAVIEKSEGVRATPGT
ncbi:MAG: class I SAM-dependent methyltransferase [Candidatus Brocadiia bacterium]